jgi:hypothetical protein
LRRTLSLCYDGPADRAPLPTDAERPGLRGGSSLEGIWPEFLYHDAVANEFFGRAVRDAPELQFYAWDEERDEVVGQANAVPAAWDGDAESLPETVGARVAAEARPGEVLVSSTVKDLVARSGIEFEDRGRRSLKGAPGEWQLYAVRAG